MTPKRIRRTAIGGTQIHATTLTSTRRRADVTRQVDVDNASSAVGSNIPITPPYDIPSLIATFEQSNMLRQCIQAYVTNIALYGWEIIAAAEGTPIEEGERLELQSFIDSPNADESLTTIHSKIVEDYEKLGFSYLEAIRDKTRRVSILRHAKGSITQVCPKSKDPIPVRYDVARGRRTAYVTENKTFRLYSQMVGGKRTYFKEFGDPRKLDYISGKYEDRENPVPPEREATELIHFRQNSEDAYGVPRWINQLPSILGSRESEEVNLRYFEDNTIPPMILSVAGGRLTGESFRNLNNLLKGEDVGKGRQNKIMLIEAVPERESLDDKGSVTLQVDKLADVRPSDGLFKEYDESNQAKVRSAFRLPPVAVGLSQDVTFATANVSAFIAETQVYAPARSAFDEVYNKRLVNHQQGLNLKTVCLRSKAPAITNPETLIKSLTALNVMGAVTPRTAQEAANKILQIELPPYPKKGEEGYEDWMDKPIIFNAKGSGNTGIDPAGNGNTHETQAQKDAAQKALEASGNVSPTSPENGQQ